MENTTSKEYKRNLTEAHKPLEDGERVQVADRQARIDSGVEKALGSRQSDSAKYDSATHHSQTHHSATHNVSLEDLQRRFQQLVQESDDYESLAGQVLEITSNLTNSLWCGLVASQGSGQLSSTISYSGIENQNLGIHQSSIFPTVAKSLVEARAQVKSDNALTIVCVPVFGKTGSSTDPCESVCLALNLGGQLPQPFLLIAQLVASTLGQWHFKNQNEDLDWEADSTAATAELMAAVINAENSGKAAVAAANELARFLDSSLIAIGFCKRKTEGKIRIGACSGVSQLDRGSQQSRLIETVLEEALIRKGVTTLPEIGNDDRSLKIAHKKLMESYPDSRLVSSSLSNSDGETIGAWLSVIPNDHRFQNKVHFFHQAVGTHLADAFHANQKANVGLLKRLGKSFAAMVGGKTGRLILLACLLVASVMLIPVPHRVSCNCTLKPKVRRFAVAPHDGILLKSVVRPGDVVTTGQVIAIMDDCELALQLANLTAQRETALRKRDVNRSGRDAAAIQMSELEVEQLNAEIELVEFKRSNLEIKSSVDGVVLNGELDDAEGASVRQGDVLLEIASLDELRLEVYVPESDVSYVARDSKLNFVLEGSPFESMTGRLKRIRPATELRNDRNVFVAEVQVENRGNELRPGMQGMARVEAGSRFLGWVLFHRPAERVYRMFR